MIKGLFFDPKFCLRLTIFAFEVVDISNKFQYVRNLCIFSSCHFGSVLSSIYYYDDHLNCKSLTAVNIKYLTSNGV